MTECEDYASAGRGEDTTGAVRQIPPRVPFFRVSLAGHFTSQMACGVPRQVPVKLCRFALETPTGQGHHSSPLWRPWNGKDCAAVPQRSSLAPPIRQDLPVRVVLRLQPPYLCQFPRTSGPKLLQIRTWSDGRILDK